MEWYLHPGEDDDDDEDEKEEDKEADKVEDKEEKERITIRREEDGEGK